MGKKFDKNAHAAEELVAETVASILGAHLNLPPSHIEDNAAYIGHWMKLLADDKRAFSFGSRAGAYGAGLALGEKPTAGAQSGDEGVNRCRSLNASSKPFGGELYAGGRRRPALVAAAALPAPVGDSKVT